MKQILKFVSILMLTFTASINASYAQSANCAFSAEKAALDFRVMQSDLMIAALTCGQRDSYNHFIKNNRDLIIVQSENLKDYFTRVYGDNAENKLNKFITSLANRTSRASLGKPLSEYCAETASYFNTINGSADNINEVITLASDTRFESGIKTCTDAIQSAYVEE